MSLSKLILCTVTSHQGRQSFLLPVLEMESRTFIHTKQLLIPELCLQSFDIFIYSGYEFSDKKLVNVMPHSVKCLHPAVLCCAEFVNLIKSYLSVLAILSRVWGFLFRKSLPAASVWKCCPHNVFLVISEYGVLHFGLWSVFSFHIYLPSNHLCAHMYI